MKSILIIGIGHFGNHLASDFLNHGNDVMIVDMDERKIEELVPYVTSAKIGDCTNVEVLKSLGIRNFDYVFVCIGDNFQSSLEITSLVKELGGKRVISKASRDIQAKFLLKNGADEVIYPDRDIAEKCASRYSVSHVFDYIELSEGYAIYEVPPYPKWVGKSIRESNIAASFGVSILGIRRLEAKPLIMPGADYVIQPDDHLMVLAPNKKMEAILKQIK